MKILRNYLITLNNTLKIPLKFPQIFISCCFTATYFIFNIPYKFPIKNSPKINKTLIFSRLVCFNNLLYLPLYFVV